MMKTYPQDNRNGWHIAEALAVCVLVGIGGSVVALGKWCWHWKDEFFGKREIV